MALEDEERLTPEEAQAVIRLWSRQQWERQHWPTVADVAEGLEISVADAEALLTEVRTRPGGTHPADKSATLPPIKPPMREGKEGYWREGASSCTSPPPPVSGGWRTCPPGGFLRGGFRLAASVAGLTGFFCLYLSRLLA